MNPFLKSTTAAIMLSALATTALADWIIEDEWSSLSFASTKKQHVAEAHVIDGLSGSLSDDGALEVTIDLTSHNSGIEIRDKRIADVLFNVVATPTATFVGEVDMDEVSALGVGESTSVLVEGDLTIAGMDNFIDFSVLATRVAENRVVVATIEPIIVDSVDYGLDNGVEELRQLAKLDIIALSVPVHLNLSFSR